MDYDDYLSSEEFKEELDYWNKWLSNIGEYVKFYNIPSDNYKSQKIHFDDETINNFLKDKDISKFDLITSIFSLYLARINQSKGCLIKTKLSENNKNSLLKIDYHEDYSFNENLKEIRKVYDEALSHTTLDIENYIEDELSYYGVYDFTAKNVNSAERFALSLNIYDNHLELIIKKIIKIF